MKISHIPIILTWLVCSCKILQPGALKGPSHIWLILTTACIEILWAHTVSLHMPQHLATRYFKLTILFEWIDTKWKVLTYCESDSALHCRKNPRLFVVLSLSCPWLLLGMAMIFLQVKKAHLPHYFFCLTKRILKCESQLLLRSHTYAIIVISIWHHTC